VVPGFKYDMEDPDVTMKIYSSGKIVLSGGVYFEFFYRFHALELLVIKNICILLGKSEEEVYRAFDKILEIVKPFKKQ